MEIIVIVFIAASVGAILAATPARSAEYTGVLILPTVSTVVAGLVWAGLLWAGNAPESVVMWIVPVLVGAIAAIAAGVAIGRIRSTWTKRRLEELLHV